MPTPSHSLWETEPTARAASALAAETTVDVCVVGGGIAGLTTAYLLASEGMSVVLLDAADAVGSGETMYTTAHLAWVLDDRFARVAEVRGDEVARAAADSHRGAIELIAAIARSENIECDFARVPGYLFPGKDGPATLRKEEEAMARLGIVYEALERAPVAEVPRPCVRFADQGEFHPTKYLAGVANALRTRGGTIHTKTRVKDISGGSPCEVSTATGHTVRAKAVVVATNAPFGAGVLLHTKVAAYTTYAVALELPTGAVPHALYWDTQDPYHYARVARTDDASEVLIVGGEDHKTGQADDQAARWERVATWGRKAFPKAGAVRHHWSGQVFETPDGLGLIGAAPWGRNVYVITGDSGMGLTHGTLGARLVANLIRGRDEPLASVYDPSRWMPAALRTFLSENLNLAAQYTSWLTGGDVKSVDEIPNGQGAVVRSGLSKLAVYKERDGTVCEMSAKCPHMGAVVSWNPGEGTWDCPAHGSRFGCKGDVMHGPAVDGLKRAEE